MKPRRGGTRGAALRGRAKSAAANADAARAKQRWRGLHPDQHGQYFANADDYAACCVAGGLTPWPVTAPKVEDWIIALGESVLPSTVSTYVDKLRLFCTAEGLTFPSKDELKGARLNIRGQRRHAWRDVERAPPIRLRHLRRFVRRRLDLAKPQHCRLAAMLYVGHGAMLRSVELRRLRDCDIEVTSFGVRVWVAPTSDKTQVVQRAKAREVWIPAKGTEAREMLLRWRHHYKPRRSTDSAWETAPSYYSWLRQLKEVGAAVGVDGATTHSLRAGGCTDFLEGDCSKVIVQRNGRWASDCYEQYYRPSAREISSRLGNALLSLSGAALPP